LEIIQEAWDELGAIPVDVARQFQQTFRNNIPSILQEEPLAASLVARSLREEVVRIVREWRKQLN
jgi:hypothetical protein